MNVILNYDDAHILVTLVSAQILDHVDLSPKGRKLIEEWRRDRNLGTSAMDDFTVFLNERIGNYVDERTTRMMRTKGKVKVSETGRWS